MERTILLVDDEEDNIAALARLLKLDTYKILRATNGMEGLALLDEHEVGVVISDQRMPEMSGVEFLTRVRQLFPHTIRIMLSGYSDHDAMLDAINRGAIYKFFTKPWDNETLRAEVLGAFQHRELILEKEHLLLEIEAANNLLAQVNQEWISAVAQRDIQIERISNFNPLTNLPNRLSFLERLDQDISRAQRSDSLVAVLSLNLDQFKQINDSLGHPMGDVLLQAVAARLKKHARTGDTVAHMGVDEFAFVLPGIMSAQAAADVALILIDTCAREPVLIGRNEVFITTGIGIAIYPLDGEDANMLLKNANAAMHHAKAEGPGSFQYYTQRMNASAWQQLSLKSELYRALERNEFVLHYQPKIELFNGKVVGMEALLRWQSPERGLVAPGEFIAMLEKTGLILQVGTWALDTACQQARTWQDAGLHAADIAVNLSALQLKQPDFVSNVRNILAKSRLNLDMTMIEFELTESLLMKDMDGTMHTLNELQDLGIRLSIDDFGTGYSCLSYLKHLPVNSLKIDQSFIRHLPDNSKDAAIVNTIVALGHGLNLNVIAEGVETLEQLAYLQELGCNEAQGYLFSRPVPVNEMTMLLQRGLNLELITGG